MADRGIGIAPEWHEKIFEPFQRLHGRDEYRGTGIGLAICQKAVERLGGRLWVSASEGNGAHFRFTLEPAAEEPTETTEAQPSLSLATASPFGR